MSNSGDESVTSVLTELVETYQKLRVTLSSTEASLCKELNDKGKDLRKHLFTLKNSVDTSFSSSHSVSSRSPERKGLRVKLPTIELPHLHGDMLIGNDFGKASMLLTVTTPI